MIDGVAIHPLEILRDERGQVMHMLRADSPHFKKFGEIYFSMVFPGRVKGWHLHREMTLNYAVPIGEVLVVLYDERDDSPTRGELMEIPLGDSDYSLLTIPPGIWNGFLGRSNFPSLVANCADLPHFPEEILRINPFDPRIPYDWDADPRLGAQAK